MKKQYRWHWAFRQASGCSWSDCFFVWACRESMSFFTTLVAYPPLHLATYCGTWLLTWLLTWFFLQRNCTAYPDRSSKQNTLVQCKCCLQWLTITEIHMSIPSEFSCLLVHTKFYGCYVALREEFPHFVLCYVPWQVSNIYSVISLHHFWSKSSFCFKWLGWCFIWLDFEKESSPVHIKCFISMTWAMSDNSKSSFFYKRKLPLLLTCQLHQEPMLVWLLLQSAGGMPQECQQVMKMVHNKNQLLKLYTLFPSEDKLSKQHNLLTEGHLLCIAIC